MREKKLSHWKNSETKKLFNLVEQYKEKNAPLSKCFKDYAEKSNRKPNSVRNYYYQELSFLQENQKKSLSLGIDLSKHTKTVGKSFDSEETNALIKNIQKLQESGYSVRKACLKLANGDINEMVRLQNKYRSEIAKQSTPLRPKNITMMPQRNKLNDSDIQSLFLGLINLVKKSALENVDFEIQQKLQNANISLRKMLVELAQKESEINRLRKEFKIIACKNEELTSKLDLLKIQTAQLTKNKMQSLKSFSQKNKLTLSKKTN